MANTLEDYPRSLKSMILGPDIMYLALEQGIDAAVQDREARKTASRELLAFDGQTVLIVAPRIAYYSLQQRVLRGLEK